MSKIEIIKRVEGVDKPYSLIKETQDNGYSFLSIRYDVGQVEVKKEIKKEQPKTEEKKKQTKKVSKKSQK